MSTRLDSFVKLNVWIKHCNIIHWYWIFYAWPIFWPQ